MTKDERKQAITDLLQIAFSPGKTNDEKRALMSKIINAGHYVQHSAVVPDGFDGLMSLIETFDQTFEDYGVKVIRLIADDNYVWAHCHYTYGSSDPRGKAIIEIFRFEGERVVEHWDVIQDVPETFANPNGMF